MLNKSGDMVYTRRTPWVETDVFDERLLFVRDHTVTW